MDYETAKKRLSDLRMELERKLAACLLNIARLIRGAVAEIIPLEETEECVPEAKYHTEEQDNGEESQHRLGDVGDDDLPLDDILSLPIEKNAGNDVSQSRYSSNTLLIGRFQDNHDKYALEQLVLSNRGLVTQQASRYVGYLGHSLDFEDLMQEGFIGLLDAARRFDRSRGTQFSTYAIWWVRQRISRAIGEQGFVVRLPIYLIETINKIRNAEERLSFRTETIDVDQLCTELELTLDKYLETKKYSYRFLSLASLDAPVSEDDSELMDFIAGATHEPIAQVNDEYIDVESVAMTNFRKEAINDLVATLSDREQTVIRLRFGLDDDQNRTLQQVGEVLGVTRERVRQIEKRALKKLRNRVEHYWPL
ncbi:MAG: sigma-70 family RNA polymerase sigma factor [Firmicutes bacterium]|nr:sigma-70 family RNA polymerase sigma factor [Bacillota bacterium]